MALFVGNGNKNKITPDIKPPLLIGARRDKELCPSVTKNASPEIIPTSLKGGGGVKIRPILLHNRIQSRQMKRYYRGDNDMSLSPSL